jgi:formylglycine-generating enzyme required for sulfatase activity
MRFSGRSLLVPLAMALSITCVYLQANATEPASQAGTQPASAATSQPAGELVLVLDDETTMRLALIPAGKFLLGSPLGDKNRQADERLPRDVTISKPFYMGIYEVTQKQYLAVTGKAPSQFKGENNPVERVSWDDAVEFCKKLSSMTGKSVFLPTDAQWEYACRAGTTTPFNTGDTITADQANFNGSAIIVNGRPGKFRQKTIPVGEFKPNAFGLYDMHGNVWEWCADWYDGRYYISDNRTDPTGPASGRYRVFRGGGWIGNQSACQSSAYSGQEPDTRNNNIGFRVCVEYNQP